MSSVGWTLKELLKCSMLLLSGFVVMYAVVLAETPSFSREGRQGVILIFFKTIIGNNSIDAGYNMMLILTVLILVGAVFAYYGFKCLHRGLKMPKE